MLINSYWAFFIFHLFFLHLSMTTLLQLGGDPIRRNGGMTERHGGMAE